MERSNSYEPATKSQGEIWLGSLLSEEKKRPLLIVSKSKPLTVVELDVSVATITTHSPRSEYDIEIDWNAAGLNRPSIIRANKINTIPSINLEFKIGSLSEEDLNRVMDTIRNKLF